MAVDNLGLFTPLESFVIEVGDVIAGKHPNSYDVDERGNTAPPRSRYKAELGIKHSRETLNTVGYSTEFTIPVRAYWRTYFGLLIELGKTIK